MIEFFNGIPISITNTVPMKSNETIVFNNKSYEGFYVSYNYSSMDYGCPTTALVIGQGQGFFILEGDYTSQYKELFNDGFEACYNYFLSNEKKSNFSDTKESIAKWEKMMENIRLTKGDK